MIKRRVRNLFKFLLPILMLVIGIVFVIVFEFSIKDNIDTVQVVVAKENIGFKQKITNDDLTVLKVKKDNRVKDAYRSDEVNYVIGEFASISINKGTQLYPELIDSYDLIPDESKGEFIAPIPSDWLFAVPGSLRRSYIADIYVVANDKARILESLVSDSKEYDAVTDSDEKETTNENEEESSSKEDTQNDLVETTVKSDVKIKEMTEPILENVRVASVKDSGNKEVTQAQESNSPESATGNVSQLEIIATSKTLQTIQEKTTNGYKLYIVYKYERGDNNVNED